MSAEVGDNSRALYQHLMGNHSDTKKYVALISVYINPGNLEKGIYTIIYGASEITKKYANRLIK